MPTQQIPHDQWDNYLAEFSADNQARNVIVEMDNNELGPQRIIDGMPLLSVESDLEDEEMIVVIAGGTHIGHPLAMSHEVVHPRAIWVKQTEDGKPEAMDIETDEGRTIIEFA